MKNKEILIGIDPDVDESGFALKNLITGDTELRTLGFIELQEILRDWHRKEVTLVIIEAGWLNKPANFRKMIKKRGVWVPAPSPVKERMASRTGRNEQIGRLLVRYCERYGIDYRLSRPSKAKVSPELFERITGFKTRNQEKIDAAMLLQGY